MLFQVEKLRYRSVLEIDYLEIPDGKTCCIYGESGAGKSTLLRLLNHLISPDEGRVLYRGTDVAELDPIELRRNVVMLAQQPVMFSGNMQDNLLVGLKFAEQDRLVTDQELRQMLDFLRLDKPLQNPVDKLSGGEKQRLALGRVLLIRPEVLLLDEPSASLDEDTEEVLVEHVVEYCKAKQIALIMVTHAKGLVERHGEYKISLSHGRLGEEAK